MKYSLRSLMIVVLVVPPILAYWYFQTTNGGYWSMKDTQAGIPIIAAAGGALLIRLILSRASQRKAP
jgi:hypothetical protein